MPTEPTATPRTWRLTAFGVRSAAAAELRRRHEQGSYRHRRILKLWMGVLTGVTLGATALWPLLRPGGVSYSALAASVGALSASTSRAAPDPWADPTVGA